MPKHPLDFDALVAPIGADAFFSKYWEREHLILHRGQPTFYQSLITVTDLETLISDSDARYPAIRLAKGGGYFSAESYTRDIRHGDVNFIGVPNIKRIAEEYRRGATIALPAMHRTWGPLGLLCDAMQRQLDHPAHANGYITPGNAAGFTPHYDVHEVFVLQIAGEKRWSIYSPVIPLPHRSQPCTPEAYTGQSPIAQVDLRAGDLLYLPRGFLHSTTTSDRFSAHVTVGITVYTWADLMKEFLASAIADPHLRRALPAQFASRSDLLPVLRQGLMSAIDGLGAEPKLDTMIDGFTHRVRAAHPPRQASFKIDETVIGKDSVLHMPARENYLMTHGDGGAVLEFGAVRYQLPEPVASTLKAMSLLKSFTANQLPNHLDIEGRLELVRHLRDIGFLT